MRTEVTRRQRRAGFLLLLFGALCALLPLLPAAPKPAAHFLAWLALPLFSIGAACIYGWRAPDDDWRRRMRDLLSAVALYALPYLAATVIVLWPLRLALRTRELAPVLWLGFASGLLLLALWNAWAAFVRVAQAGGSLRRLLAQSDPEHERAGLAWALALLGWIGLGALLASPRPVPTGLLTPMWTTHAGIGLALALAMARWGRSKTAPTAENFSSAGTQSGPETELAYDAASLYAATRAGDIELALRLLAAGGDANALPTPDDPDQRTLPMLAARLPDLRLLRALLAAGIDINTEHAGQTALLSAVAEGSGGGADAVLTLLANGADPNVRDARGATPLHHAASASDPALSAALIDAGAALDALDREEWSPLAVACATGNWRIARLLLERGARIEPEGGRSALLAAAGGEDDAAGVELLLRYKARLDVSDAQGRSALGIACARNNVDIAAALLAAGADPNGRDASADAPLLCAAKAGHTGIIRLLGERANLDRDVVDAEGRNALALACLAEHDDPSVVEALIAIGVDPNCVDHTGRTPLQHAMAGGRWRILAVLNADAETDPAIPTLVPETEPEALAPATRLHRALVAGDLVGAQAIIDTETLDPAALDALLLEFVDQHDPQPALWLLAHGARADRRHDVQESVLFHLLGRGEGGVLGLRRLLDAGIAVNAPAALARWLHACVRGVDDPEACERLALELLARGVDPFAADSDGSPCLCLAAKLDWPQLLEALLHTGLDPATRDARGFTALHVACVTGNEALLRPLLRHGAPVAARAPDGQTALGIALANGRSDLAYWLEWTRWPWPNRPLRDSDLPAAAMAGDLAAVERLLALGTPVDGRDAQGCTALLRAAGAGQRNIVEYLLRVGANPTLAAHTGATPLSAAVSMRQGEIVEALLVGGAPVDQPLPGGVTPLMVACALGLNDLIRCLLAHHAKVLAIDDQGHAPLHYAAHFLFQCSDRKQAEDLLDTLLRAGAQADAPSDSGHTPLLLLLGARADVGARCDEAVILAALERLLAQRVTLDAREARGFTPLHLSALHGLAQVTRRLILAGADRQQRDHLNRTPQEIAVLRGFVDVAAEFEPARAGASIASFLRRPDHTL